MSAYCKTCGNKIEGNIPFELGIIDLVGYHEYCFCNPNCFLVWIVDNYKKKLKRVLK